MSLRRNKIQLKELTIQRGTINDDDYRQISRITSLETLGFLETAILTRPPNILYRRLINLEKVLFRGIRNLEIHHIYELYRSHVRAPNVYIEDCYNFFMDVFYYATIRQRLKIKQISKVNLYILQGVYRKLPRNTDCPLLEIKVRPNETIEKLFFQ